MTPKIIWRYRRKHYLSSAAKNRLQDHRFANQESQAAGSQPQLKWEKSDNSVKDAAAAVQNGVKVQFQAEEGDVQAKVQRQEEEEAAQTKIQRQEEEEETQTKVQFQEEEEEAQAKVQFQEEEEEAQAKVQFQEEEEEAQAKVQLQEEEEAQTKIQFQEEEEAQTKIQFQEEEEAQAKPETVPMRSGRLIRSVAKSGFTGHPGSYPFQRRIQAAFGRHDISNVRAFNDAAAQRANRKLSSLAYASRDKVAFRGYPDLHTAAHEAAHIIQQRQGVQLKDGAGRKGDSYERHADNVADRVVQGKSVQSLLDKTPGMGSEKHGVVQRKGEREVNKNGCALIICGRRERKDDRPTRVKDPIGAEAHDAQHDAFKKKDTSKYEVTAIDAGKLKKDEAPMTEYQISVDGGDIWDVNAVRTVLFDEEPRLSDVIQSRVSSCSLLSVLMSLTQSQNGRKKIRDIVSIQPDGFWVKFYHMLEHGIVNKFRSIHVWVPFSRAPWQAEAPRLGPYALTDETSSWLKKQFYIPEQITLVGSFYKLVGWAWAIEKAFAGAIGNWAHVDGSNFDVAYRVLLGIATSASVPNFWAITRVQFFIQLLDMLKKGIPLTATPRKGHELPITFTHSYYIMDADESGVILWPKWDEPQKTEKVPWHTFLSFSANICGRSLPWQSGKPLKKEKTAILDAYNNRNYIFGEWEPTVNFDGKNFLFSGHGYSIASATSSTISLEEPTGQFPLYNISHKMFCGMFSEVYSTETIHNVMYSQ